jgi:hypothetical protein
MYIGYLCYPHPFDDDEEDREAVLKFTEPDTWKYEKVIPIQFSVLHSWTINDKKLYS